MTPREDQKRRMMRVLRTVNGLSRDDREWLSIWLNAHWAGSGDEESAWFDLGEIVAGAKLITKGDQT
jgi:hypothetical protein